MSRPSRRLLHLLLVAIFWIAQVQGTVHAIGHLGAAGVSDGATAPHGIICVECAALAQAGAAPVLSLPATALFVPTGGFVATSTTTVVVSAPAAAYNSRAPPFSPI